MASVAVESENRKSVVLDYRVPLSKSRGMVVQLAEEAGFEAAG